MEGISVGLSGRRNWPASLDLIEGDSRVTSRAQLHLDARKERKKERKKEREREKN